MKKEILLLPDLQTIDPNTVFFNLREIRLNSGAWEATSSSNDPQIYLYTDSGKPLDSAVYRFLEFSLFLSAEGQGQLIWWLADGRWQTSCNISFSKGWNKYAFDMKQLPSNGALGSGIGWEGSVVRLRLDPCEKEEVEIKVRDARFTSTPSKRSLIPQLDFLKNIKENYEDCQNLPLETKSKPVLVYAEISTKCNLRCRMCGRAHYKIPASQEGLMSREVFRRLSRIFTPGGQLALFGRGESLLHPDFIYFLKTARNAHMRLGFNTNGLLLTPEMARAMVEYKQTHITFSCSAGSPETYRLIHGVDCWDKLWANIAMLNDTKRKYGHSPDGDMRNILPVMYLEFVAQLSNIRELPALVRRAYEYNLNGLMVTCLTAHSDEMEKERMNTSENVELADRYYQEALAVHRELVMKTANRTFDFRLPSSFSPITKKFITDSDKRIFAEVKAHAGEMSDGASEHFCVEPWRTFFVRFDGTVGPCCITGRKLGDLNRESAEKIWNGRGFREFREKMKSTDKPYECLHCHLFPGPHRYDEKLSDEKTYSE